MCTSLCNGNNDEVCGGSSALFNVYRTTCMTLDKYRIYKNKTFKVQSHELILNCDLMRSQKNIFLHKFLKISRSREIL
jgi:hypothetical protein